MKKTLIALAVLGATAGVAHAQSNVTIYGIVDTGYVKESGTKLYMNEKVNNRLGFRGTEDLGGGLKATFELEHRFNLFDGSAQGENVGGDEAGDLWDGAANVGLAGGFGAVRFGRVNELSTESIRTFDPFNQYGVGGMFETPLRSARISSTARYDSPNMSGFSFGASYTLKNQNNRSVDGLDLDSDAANDGYGVSVKYANGPLALAANYNRAVNTADSNNWNLGAAYSFGPAKVSALYEKTTLKSDFLGLTTDDIEAKNWLLGLSYSIGKGVINASYGQVKVDADGTDTKAKKIALGYTHNLSKRTSVYLDVARTKFDDGFYTIDGGDTAPRAADADDSVKAINIGVTHKF